MIRGFRDDDTEAVGSWGTWEEAWSWVRGHGLDADRLGREASYREEFTARGRTYLFVENGGGSVVLFDPARYPPDEVGHIAW